MPLFHTSAADDAIDLAALAGLELFPWQQHVLRGALGERVDGRWSAFRTCLVVPRQNGKNALLEARELAGIFLFGEEQITHTAHQFKTAKNSMLALMRRMKKVPDLMERVIGYEGPEQSIREIDGFKTGNEPGIYLKTNPRGVDARIQYFARSKDSGRGFTGDVVVLDEAYALKAAEMGAMLPTMRAKSIDGNPQLWITSSAPMVDSDYLMSLRRQGIEGSSDRLAYYEWSVDWESPRPLGADPIELDVDGWYVANPSLGYLVSEEHMRDEAEDLLKTEEGAEEFRRELLGIPSRIGGSSDIPMDAWRARRLPERPQGEKIRLERPCLGVDVRPDGSGAAISITGWHDGRLVTQVLRHRDELGWVADEVRQLVLSSIASGAGKIPVLAIGNSAASQLESEFRRVRIAPRWISTGQYAAACAAFKTLVVEGGIAHDGQPELDDAVAALRRQDKGKGAFIWSKATPVDDICPAVACTVSTAGAQLRPDAFATTGDEDDDDGHSMFG